MRTLGGAASRASVAAHGDGLLVLLDVLKEGDGALELPAVDSLSGLTAVLEARSEVAAASAGRLGRVDLGGGVPSLKVAVSLEIRYKGTPSSKDFRIEAS